MSATVERVSGSRMSVKPQDERGCVWPYVTEEILRNSLLSSHL